MDDVFGDFSSAFPPSGSSAAGKETSAAVQNDGGAPRSTAYLQFGEANNAAASFSATEQEGTCPLTTLSFDAFASCPLPDSGLPGFANFDQVNIADLTIPHPDTVEIGGNFFDIPPLPDILSPDDFSATDVEGGVTSKSTLLREHSPHGSNTWSEGALSGSAWANGDVMQGLAGDPSAGPPPWTMPSTTIASGTAVESGSIYDFGEFETSLSLEAGVNPGARLNQPSSSGQTELSSVSNFAVVTSTVSTVPIATSVAVMTQGAANHVQSDTVPSIPPLDPSEKETTTASLSQSQGDSFGAFPTSRSDSNPSRGISTSNAASSLRQDSSGGQRSQEGQSDWPGLNTTPVLGDSRATATEDEFGGFSVFASSPAPPTDLEGGFADFSSFQSSHSAAGSQGFGTHPTTDSGGLGSRTVKEAETQGTQEDLEFGGFAVFPATSDGDEDSQFGDFSTGVAAASSQTADFGDFSSHTQTGLVHPEQGQNKAQVVQSPSAGVKSSMVKLSGDVLVVCFPGRDSPRTTTPPVSRLHPQSPSHEQESHTWVSLQRSVDFTVPLYKWDKSYLQECYHGALKIDPGLAGPGALPAFATDMNPFDIPLGRQSAVEDLMESFGFGAELSSAAIVSPSSPHVSSEFARNSVSVYGTTPVSPCLTRFPLAKSRLVPNLLYPLLPHPDEGTPALLDLSLPTSPDAQDKKNAFSSVLAADLQGLDLNPAPSQPQQLTSIQELLLNERLVINRSTWIDSQILELEGRTEDVSQHPPSSSPSTLSSPRRENSVEQQLLQLGLDVSKTTIVSSSQQNELSLSARTVLGQLPELTFMLSDCIIEV